MLLAGEDLHSGVEENPCSPICARYKKEPFTGAHHHVCDRQPKGQKACSTDS